MHSEPNQCENVDSCESGRPNIQELIDQYHQRVYRYAYRLAGNEADAEDIVQHTFLVAMQKLDQLKSRAAAGGWLMTIARNGFLNRIKIEQRRKTMPASASKIDMEQFPEPVPTHAEFPCNEASLKQSLMSLGDSHRVILLMFYFEKLSYREIAEHLDLKIGTVMSRLSRAKTKLRRAILETGENSDVATESAR